MALALVEEEDGGVMPTRYFSRAAQAALLEGASRTHTSQTPALEMMHENLAKFLQNFASLMTANEAFQWKKKNE